MTFIHLFWEQIQISTGSRQSYTKVAHLSVKNQPPGMFINFNAQMFFEEMKWKKKYTRCHFCILSVNPRILWEREGKRLKQIFVYDWSRHFIVLPNDLFARSKVPKIAVLFDTFEEAKKLSCLTNFPVFFVLILVC